MSVKNAPSEVVLDQDLVRTLTDAVRKTAEELTARAGFDAAHAEGTTLVAQSGRYRFVVKNSVTTADSGRQEQVLDLYARMVVRQLLRTPDGRGPSPPG